MLVTFALLCVSIGAVWLPDLRVPGGMRIPAWHVVFATFLGSGLLFGDLTGLAVVALVLTWAAAAASIRGGSRVFSLGLATLVCGVALALAVHLVPGFNNPMVASGLRLSANSPPITQYASLDKGAAGLILLAYYCRRARSLDEAARATATGLIVGAGNAVLVVGLIAGLGFVAWDPKLPEFALLWIPINLLLTCVAEEAFFRGILQERLSTLIGQSTRWQILPIAISSLLFGLVHAGGGIGLVVAATIAGVGYGLAYAKTRRIESAVLAHFTLNAVHFFGFTYPYAVR